MICPKCNSNNQNGKFCTQCGYKLKKEDAKLTYDFLAREFATNPRDLHTIPQNSSAPKWFHVYYDGNLIRCSSPKMEEHFPKCEFSVDRKLFRNQFEGMVEVYKAGRRGESRSKYAKDNHIDDFCTSYWMGILYEYKKYID